MLDLERVQIISILASTVFLAFIAQLIRRQLIKEAYGILWLFFGCLFLFFSIWKKGLDYFAAIFGIYYPPAFLFLLLIAAIIFILVQFSMVISAQNDKIRTLSQELALLKNKCEQENVTGKKS
jgi:hypothetical protein